MLNPAIYATFYKNVRKVIRCTLFRLQVVPVELATSEELQ